MNGSLQGLHLLELFTLHIQINAKLYGRQKESSLSSVIYTLEPDMQPTWQRVTSKYV